MPELAGPGPQGRGQRLLLGLGLVLLHLWLLDDLARSRLGEGAGERPPPRIEVAFVRELAPAAPPAAVAPAPAAAPPPRLAAVADSAKAPPLPPKPASAPSPELPAPVLAEAPPPTPPPLPPPAPVEVQPRAAVVAAAEAPAASVPASVTASVTAAASVPAAASAMAAAEAAVPQVDWPPSTQLNFRLLGNFRGEVHGSARVEWLREGGRYQVRMDSSAGPLFSRRAVSEGEIGARGLAPRRFSAEQSVLFRGTRRWAIQFGPERVVLSDGREAEALAGAQDEVSQFVQLTWLFTTQPERLRVGQSVELPLAIGRRLERWTYDVAEQEDLRLPFGVLPTHHLKPRRQAGGGDLTAELWIAPSLQYLPVRILLRQSAEVWVDLQLEQAPLQAQTQTQTQPPR